MDTKAAPEEGLPMAQCNLGVCYKHGNGVENTLRSREMVYKKQPTKNMRRLKLLQFPMIKARCS